MDSLPAWREHSGHRKIEPLRATDDVDIDPAVLRFLDEIRRRNPERATAGGLRVLDVGCGRGATVAWLLEQGWDAWGVEVSEDYLEQGAPYIEELGYHDERLRLTDGGPLLPFEAETFDIVLSKTVIEHVADIDSFATGLARVSKRATLGLHIVPARWSVVEPHMHIPLAHWLPKGRLQRRALHGAIRAGASAPYFKELPSAQRAKVFGRFYDDEVFYRSERELRHAFTATGVSCDFVTPTREKIAARLPRVLPAPVRNGAAFVYRHSRLAYLRTTQL